VIVDLQSRTVQTYVGDGAHAARQHLDSFDLIAGVDVRGILRSLDLSAQRWRLAELGPPQKTMKLSPRGRPLRLTTELLLLGSCGLKRVYDPARIQRKLAAGALTAAQKLLESEAKALVALYNYGCVHGHVRLRYRGYDTRLSAPWVHFDAPVLHHLLTTAFTINAPVQVVVGSAPDWEHPWARAELATVGVTVEQERVLVDRGGRLIHPWDVQLARLAMQTH